MRQYLREFWKGLNQLPNLTRHVDCELDFSQHTQDMLGLFKEATVQQRNALIFDIMIMNEENFTSKDLEDMRRNMEGWIKNMNKSDRRGEPVVPEDKRADFKDKVNIILDYIPYRSQKLRQNLFIKALQSLNFGVPVNNNTCSKTWWHTYCNNNPDIGRKWDAIPLEKQKEAVRLRAQAFRGEDQNNFDFFHSETENEYPFRTEFQLFDEVDKQKYGLESIFNQSFDFNDHWNESPQND